MFGFHRVFFQNTYRWELLEPLSPNTLAHTVERRTYQLQQLVASTTSSQLAGEMGDEPYPLRAARQASDIAKRCRLHRVSKRFGLRRDQKGDGGKEPVRSGLFHEMVTSAKNLPRHEVYAFARAHLGGTATPPHELKRSTYSPYVLHFRTSQISQKECSIFPCLCIIARDARFCM